MAKSLQYHSKRILEYLYENPLSSSYEIYSKIGPEIGISYSTLKRVLQKLQDENLISQSGQGKGTRYQLSKAYQLLHFIDMESYFQKEIDEREINETYNRTLITDTLGTVSVFTDEELAQLTNLQKKYTENIANLSASEYHKELERLAIDLSWKSSQIEGNTYSLLETERLLKERETAAGKTKDEAVMLLNHKEALDFIIANPTYTIPLSVSKIEDIHSILIKDLHVERNIRKHRVGISGTNYKPLENEFQIREAFSDMCDLINTKKSIFEKALLVLALLSYIQPFADGNKRTARILSNTILLNYKHCPISFRTVDSMEYKKAMMIFYEQNNISAFKKIFMAQFEFAVNTYF